MGQRYLERYEAEERVGQGGMALVFRGIDHVLRRPVAIKVLHPHLLDRPEARARFAREATVIAKLRHANIVEVYDVSGESSDQAFIVTEFIDGMVLSELLLRHGPLMPETAAAVVGTVARALAHAHERGVIHRDVKPENIMVRRDGVLKLMDFGIAHVTDMEHLTMTGAILGSPAHMSPEQVDGQALDARTDIFSLGTLFYLLASGHYPFQADTPSGLLRAIVELRCADIRTVRPDFPDELHAILTRMMARDPDQRFASAAGLADAIDAALAAVGMGSGEAESVAFFQDPEGYVPLARGRLIQARLARADRMLAERRQAAAMREANLVLAQVPGHPQALRVLGRARAAIRRQRVSRGVAWALLGATVVAGLAFLVTGWVSRRQEAPPPAPISQALAPRGVEEAPFVTDRRAPSLPPTATSPGTTRAGAANGTRPPREPPAAREARFPVTIQAFPPAVRIEVDGRFVGEGRVDDLMLAPGPHRVRLTHPSCTQCRPVEHAFTLDPTNPLKAPLRLSIGYRDARLIVRGAPNGRVFVNREARPRGRTNGELLIPMSRPDAVATQVRVEWDGGVSRDFQVTLTPGQDTVLRVE